MSAVAIEDRALAEMLRLRELNKELATALRDLVEVEALSDVRRLVAGWNGESLPVPHSTRHDSRLDATLRTNCGAVYSLDERMQAGRALLAKCEARP